MGIYDIPATLDYITDVTGIQKHAYVGHSQGTTQMYVGTAELADYYAEKLSIFVALAPVSKITHTEVSLFRDAAHFYDEVDDFLNLFNIHSLLNKTWYTSGAVGLVCNTAPWFCYDLEEIFVTADTEWDDKDRFQVYMNHAPNGSSTKSILHYA